MNTISSHLRWPTLTSLITITALLAIDVVIVSGQESEVLVYHDGFVMLSIRTASWWAQRGLQLGVRAGFRGLG